MNAILDGGNQNSFKRSALSGKMAAMSAVSIFAPAKLNLLLAVTGRRPDGFHDLVSVVARVDVGDTLRLETTEAGAVTGEGSGEPVHNQFELTCNDPEVPLGESNLVIRAAHRFASDTGWTGRGRFQLEKQLPMGAGLGGGSSDGVAALQALNTVTGERLSGEQLAAAATSLGSDCALFLRDGPVVMRGRGERVEDLPAPVTKRLQGRRVLIFKPDFGISTPWAYGQMIAHPETYLPSTSAEARLAGFMAAATDPDPARLDVALFNNMELPAFAKYVALPTLLDQLRQRFALAPRMSGSGSACFAFLPDGAPVAEITRAIHDAWGKSAWVRETRIL